MEDLETFIEISLGVVLFIIAVSINIVLYNSMHDAIENAMTINNIHSEIVVEDDKRTEIQKNNVEYTAAEAYYIMRGLIEYLNPAYAEARDKYHQYRELDNELNDKIDLDSIVEYVKLNGSVSEYSLERIQTTFQKTFNFQTMFKQNYKYNIEYIYQYGEFERLNMTNHYVSKVRFIEVN